MLLCRHSIQLISSACCECVTCSFLLFDCLRVHTGKDNVSVIDIFVTIIVMAFGLIMNMPKSAMTA